MMIVNDDSRAVAKLETSLTDDARVVLYDCYMFIVQVTDDEGHVRSTYEVCVKFVRGL
jgi:hypothetical protein